MNEYTSKMVKTPWSYWKTLKVKGENFNALIWDEMNVLIIKHYVMSFQKEIRQQVQYEGVDKLKW